MLGGPDRSAMFNRKKREQEARAQEQLMLERRAAYEARLTTHQAEPLHELDFGQPSPEWVVFSRRAEQLRERGLPVNFGVDWNHRFHASRVFGGHREMHRGEEGKQDRGHSMAEHEEQYKQYNERVFRPQEEQEKEDRQRVVETHPAASVYRFYDERGKLLYVGVTSRGMNRFSEHGQMKKWWPRVRTTKVEHFATYQEALRAERTAIRSEAPVHNIQNNPLGRYRQRRGGSK